MLTAPKVLMSWRWTNPSKARPSLVERFFFDGGNLKVSGMRGYCFHTQRIVNHEELSWTIVLDLDPVRFPCFSPRMSSTEWP
jgi:hypothetical protein